MQPSADRSRRLARTGVVLASLALLALLTPSLPAQDEKGRTADGPEVRAAAPSGVQWPQFRGPRASGIAEGHATPTRWDVEKGQGVVWKTDIPGLGHASPVIWGDRIFVATAVGAGEARLRVGLYGDIDPADDDSTHRFELYCLDKRTGKVLWKRTAHEGVPRVRRHTKASHANSTPATDGKHVVVFFGSEGLYSYDMDGNLEWKRDLGLLDAGYFRVATAQWGFGSSPILHQGKVIVQCDIQGDSFVAALDAASGKELWRTPRDEVPTWGSPAIYRHAGRDRIALNGWKHIGGYDLATGEALWHLRGGGDIPVPTPVVDGEMIFVTNAHGPGSPIYAIRADAKGDITLPEGSSSNGHVAWSVDRGGAYMQTPLVYRDLLYVCRDNGTLSVYRAKTGESLYRQRLGSGSSGYTASSVAADGKLYFTSEMGDVHVVQAGPEFSELAVNPLGAISMATPAISEGVLYFRTRTQLIAIR